MIFGIFEMIISQKQKMNLKSKRRKLFVFVLAYLSFLAIFILIVSLQGKPSFEDFIGFGLFIVVLLANSIFFISNLSDINMTENFIRIKFPFLKKEVMIKYDEIIGYDNSNSSVYFFKTIDNKVFTIKKYEFQNYANMVENISSKTNYLKINIFSNAIKGIFTYLIALIIVLISFLISRIL